MGGALILAATLASAAAGAQPAPPALQPPPEVELKTPTPVAGANNQTYRTQEVSPGRTLTLRIAAPAASEAQVLLGEPSAHETVYPMRKDATGVWTAAIGPMPPEIYRYTFRLGGAKVNGGFVTVPGSPPNVWEPQAVPHGAVIAHTLFSKVQGLDRLVHVYVPPGYYADPTRRYPVFYMWKPGGADEYFAGGRPEVILDNLIAQRRAAPMIVVMPGIEVPPGTSLGSPEARDLLDRELVSDILPFVEANYRTIDDRDHRAISGISQSGATAFTVGMRHLDLFGSVGEFGTGFFGGLLNPPGYTSYVAYNPDNVTPGMNAKLKAPATRLRLLYMSVGSVDPRRPYQEKVAEGFRADGIAVTFRTFPGGHEYTTWRHSFADMAALLFK